MPKKTRKEKMRADLHRQTASTPLEFTYAATFSSSKAAINISSTSFSYIRRDLLKTLILGSLFIGVEIILAQVLK